MAQQGFTAKIGADVSGFVRGMDQAQKEAEDTTGDIEEVQRTAAAMSKEQVKLTLDATAVDLQRKIDEVKQQMKLLEDSDPTVTVKADTDQVERKLRDLKDTADISVGLDVDEGRVNTTTSAIKDIAGNLGSEAAGVVTDFSQAFNDIREQAVAAFGGPDSGFGRAMSALGPIATAALGAGVGGLLYLWQNVRKEQEEAKRRAEEYYDVLKNNQGADADKALREQILKEYDKLPAATKKAFEEAGIGLDDIVSLLKDETVPEIDNLRASWQQVMDVVPPGLSPLSPDGKRIVQDVLNLTRDQRDELLRQYEVWESIGGELNKQGSAFDQAKERYRLYSEFVREDSKKLAEEAAANAAAVARAMGTSFVPSYASPGTPTTNVYNLTITGGADPYATLAAAEQFGTRNGITWDMR